ncbi:MAG: choice-of-anchor D domain-containing protein, partial [Flavobacterium sp.]|nr:choice-of-anchor D domain-containing protein [Flavobacterium sp.]
VNTGSVTNNFTIENTGFNSLSISAVSSNSGDFIVSFPATTIAPYSSVTLPVTFNPTATGTRNGVITISNNDSNEGTYTFAVRGVGSEQEINLQGGAGPTNINNGSTTISTTLGTNFGTSASTRTFVIQNTGTSNLNISSLTSTLADYVVSVSSTSVTPGSSVTLTIVFTPATTGTRAATITIGNNDADESSYTFAVSATITDREINVRGNSTSIASGSTIISVLRNTDFGSVQVDGGTVTNSFVIENTGGLPLNVSSITCSNILDYAVSYTPTVIPAGGNMTFNITFNPITNGVRTSLVYITNDDANEANYRFNISGKGLQDNDGDTVDGSTDIDDDNDGITDIIECGACLSDPFVNGGFESPVIAAASYAILPTSSVNGWQTSAEDFIEIWSDGFNGVPAASGNQFAELNANIAGTLYQTFCLNGAGGTINWSIKHRGRGGVDQAFVKMGSSLADALASSPIVEMVDDVTAWGTYSGIYSIPVGQTQIVITFQAGYTGSGSASVGNFIDDVQIVINQGCIDSDGDGIPDTEDLDSDNDGIPDVEEAGFKQYSNNTSTFDKSNPSLWTDANSNGMSDFIAAMISGGTYNVPDSDADGLRNQLDFDSDNDSFFDVNEGGTLNGDGDINDDGKGDGIDTDKDGILDLYDNSTNFGTVARSYALDTDADGTADFLELDANNNGIFDITSSLYDNIDTNNDGKVDGTADADRDGILDAFDTNPAVKGSPRNLNKKLLLDFDGRNDYAENTPVLGGLANASLMAWIDLNSGFSSEGVVIGQDKFQIKVNSDRKLEVVANTTSITSTETLNTAQWYHVAAVYGDGFLKLFLNGKLLGTQAVSGSIQADATNLTLGKNPTSANKYFKGKIDEIRVFDVTLTETQVQRMVYQEIENNGAQVRGTIIPRDIQSLPYTNLIRYYRMDTYKDDIVDDLTTIGFDSGTGMKMYNHKNIYTQQAPMPFVTIATGSFATAVNDSTKDIRGLDLVEYDYSVIQVNHNITETSNVSTMGMMISPSITVNMNNDNKLENQWYLKLDGKIDLTGKSQLVQTTDSELDFTSAGYIERDQNGQANKFNYNYWSSPVSSVNNTTINHGFTVAGVMKDGTTSTPQNIQWTTGVNGTATSPITLSSYWIFKFQNHTNSYANWSTVGQNGTLLAGQGFTMKGSNTTSDFQNYTFVGKPNNGTITSTVGANNLNLSGNPYPSAIDADKFIDDNISTITGTLFFWEHYNTNTSHNTILYQGGYATYTKVGGTAPVAPAGISGLGSSSKTAKRFIPVGQGFFVTGSATGGTITFNNSQRLFVKETNTSSYTLFRNANPMANSNPNAINAEDSFEEQEFAKLRLGYVSANNYHRQLLIGFMNQYATSGFDNGYDAISIETLASDMYFMQGTNKLNIQGDGYFNVNNNYPLGVKNATAGIVKFAIDAKENFDDNQEVYIHDNTTGIYHSIKSQPFEINLPVGTIENRFSLRFATSSSLGTNENELQQGIAIAHSQSDNTIHIKNELLDASIKSMALFNLLGQMVTNWSLDNESDTEMHLPVTNLSSGTYIVKITTDKGDISKKILIK